MEPKDSAFHRAKKKNGVSALVYSIVIRFYKNRTVLLIGGCPLFFAGIADKGKTVSFDKIGCTSAIEASFIALGLHYFCHFLFRSSAHYRKWRNEFSALRLYGFYVVATIRCSISLALLFTK